MSGGHFNYDQYRIDNIAETIESMVRRNDDQSLDEFGGRKGYGFSPETIAEFEKAVKVLKEAYVYAQRIDWLVSGDDDEKTFHKRLAEDLERVKL